MISNYECTYMSLVRYIQRWKIEIPPKVMFIYRTQSSGVKTHVEALVMPGRNNKGLTFPQVHKDCYFASFFSHLCKGMLRCQKFSRKIFHDYVVKIAAPFNGKFSCLSIFQIIVISTLFTAKDIIWQWPGSRQRVKSIIFSNLLRRSM